jgi:hypothetical protein
MFVPVVDQNQNPLMPTTTAQAWRWIASGKATFFYKKGIFCVRLNVEPSDNKKKVEQLTLASNQYIKQLEPTLGALVLIVA